MDSAQQPCARGHRADAQIQAANAERDQAKEEALQAEAKAVTAEREAQKAKEKFEDAERAAELKSARLAKRERQIADKEKEIERLRQEAAAAMKAAKEVDHRVYGSFALSDAHGFDEYVVVSGGFAKHDGFARFSRHSSKRASRGARSNECVRVKRKFLHASFVAEDAALCNFATGVYGEHGESTAVFEDV